jgi:CMP/dCMP kinase
VSRKRPIVAIDGPVGSGKSTVARELARALGFSYLNTGAMYRAVALAACRAGIGPGQSDLEPRLAETLESIRIGFDRGRVLLDGRDVTAAITDPRIGDLASQLSTLGVVRARMKELQRAAGADGGVVMEGRDIGTAVFPDAEFKFFLDADVQVRAARRFQELAAKGGETSPDEVLAQLVERDERDRSRELAPLRRAEDAIVINSTNLAVAQVVEEMKACVEKGLCVSKDLKPA